MTDHDTECGQPCTVCGDPCFYVSIHGESTPHRCYTHILQRHDPGMDDDGNWVGNVTMDYSGTMMSGTINTVHVSAGNHPVPIGPLCQVKSPNYPWGYTARPASCKRCAKALLGMQKLKDTLGQIADHAAKEREREDAKRLAKCAVFEYRAGSPDQAFSAGISGMINCPLDEALESAKNRLLDPNVARVVVVDAQKKRHLDQAGPAEHAPGAERAKRMDDDEQWFWPWNR